MITANGMMLRTDLQAVRAIGRATQGVRLIRLDQGDRVVAVAKIAPEDEESESARRIDEAGNGPEGAAAQGDEASDTAAEGE